MSNILFIEKFVIEKKMEIKSYICNIDVYLYISQSFIPSFVYKIPYQNYCCSHLTIIDFILRSLNIFLKLIN